MKVKLLWYRDTDPFNWGDTEAKGIKNIKESLPNAKIMGTWKDGYVDVECFSILEVKTLEELIEAWEHDWNMIIELQTMYMIKEITHYPIEAYRIGEKPGATYFWQANMKTKNE